MDELLKPANIVVLAVIAVGLFFGSPHCRIDAWQKLLQRWRERQKEQEGCGDRYR